MPLSLPTEVTELDGVYVRQRERWETDTEEFEHDQPLLARAFAEAKPGADVSTALRVLGRRVQDLEAQLKNQQMEAEARHNGHLENIRMLRGSLRDSEHRVVVVSEELAKREQQIERLEKRAQIEQPEAETLAERGWTKSAG